MGDNDREEIRQLIDSRFNELVEREVFTSHCRFISIDKAHVYRVFEMAEELGSGDIGKGIRVMRDNHIRMVGFRRVYDKITAALLIWILYEKVASHFGIQINHIFHIFG